MCQVCRDVGVTKLRFANLLVSNQTNLNNFYQLEVTVARHNFTWLKI